MFIGTLKLNRALQVVFGLLTHPVLPARHPRFRRRTRSVGKIAGYEGILTGLAALYAAMAQILNETYRRVLLPLGPDQPAAQGLRAATTARRSPACGWHDLREQPADPVVRRGA